MKPSIQHRRFCFVTAALSLSASTAFSQAVPAPAASASQPSTTVSAVSLGAAAKEDALLMTPFQVSTEKDVGFVATASLAGGRMKTDLKDTPLAYSVITKEFLDALNITDSETAMEWTVNAFAYKGDAQDRISNQDGGTRTRVRGVITKSLRNFFELGRFADTYCQDRVDYARGTNALLIGNGGLGGATILLTKQAMFDKPKGEFALTTSNFGKQRATLDYNYPVNDKLALRTSLLKEDSSTWREQVFDRRTGNYLTATFRPWKKTQLRADFEEFHQKELVALNGMTDRVSGWDGVTVLDAPTATVNNSNALGVERLGASTTPYNLVLPAYNTTTMWNFANNWRTMGGGATATTPVNGILALSTAGIGAAGGRISGMQNQWDNRFTIATSKSKFFVPDDSFVYLPDTPTFTQTLRNLSVFLDQQIGNDFFAQVAFSRTRSSRWSSLLATRFSDIYVDVNRRMPDGTPNPHFLHPFIETTRDDEQDGINSTDEWRAGLGYVKDNTRFGSFRFNVLAGTLTSKGETRTYTHVMTRNPDIRQRPVNDSLGYRYYLTDGNRPFNIPSQITYVDPIAGTTQSYATQRLLNIGYSDGNNRTGMKYFDYMQASAFGKFWKDRIVLLGGYRWDKYTSKVKNAYSNNPRGTYPTDWDGQTLLFNPNAPANYWDLTATQRATYNPPNIDIKKGTVSYGGIINATTWLGGFYNFAETYDTNRTLLTVWGTVMDPLLSSGSDAGIRLSPLDGRINISISKYKTVQNHSYTGVDRTEIPRLLESNARGDTSATGRNIRNVPPVPNPYSDYQDALATGLEFEVVANITPNWRLTCNYAEPELNANNRYPETEKYLKQNYDVLKQILLDTGAVIDPTTKLAVNPGVALSDSPDINTAIASWNWVEAALASFVANVPIVTNSLKYTANIYTDYRFSRGFLKGLRVGGGVQFRGNTRIADRSQDTIVNPANPTQAIDDPSVGTADPVEMPAYHLITATLGYEMKLRDNMRLSFNLNVNNVANWRGPVYNYSSLRPPKGDISSPARVASLAGYFCDPRSFTLTARLNF